MQNISAGLLAGFVATVVLSALMLMKSAMGIMPDLDIIQMLAAMTGGSVVVAWIMHFMIGTLAWGGGFALLYALIPGSGAVQKGVVLGIAAWLMMMIVVMPLAGAGLFGLGLGIMAPVMTLMLHIIFGAVLGLVYQSRSSQAVA